MRASANLFTGLVLAALIAGPATAISASGGEGGHNHQEPDRVCVVLPSADRLDMGKGDEMLRALRRAEHRFGIESVTVQPVTNDDIPLVLNGLLGTGNCDMVAGDFFVGFAMEPIVADYPDQRFVALDFPAFVGDPPNARGVDFAHEDGSFLAGYAAAAMTKTGTVGVFGGMQFTSVTAPMDAFALGIQHHNDVKGTSVQLTGWDPGTEVGLFAGTFEDVSVGYDLTQVLFDEGADVVYPLAGPLQLGALEATQERAAAGERQRMIGVDVDLFEYVGRDPSRVILTSTVTRYDLGLFRQIRDLVRGRWEPGVAIEDLSTKGVDLAPWHRSRRDVPHWLRHDLRKIERAIIRGDIETTIDRPTGPLVVGTLFPVTGGLVVLGPPMVAGAELAVADINDAGGVFGEPVRLVQGDSGNDPFVAAQTVDALLAADSDVIVGAASSSDSLSVIDQIVGSDVIQFSPSNTLPEFTNYPDFGLYFRTAPSNTLQGEMLAELIVTESSTAAVVYRNDSYGVSIAEPFAAKFADLGGQPPTLIPYAPGEVDFADEVAQIVNADPDAVLVVSFAESAPLITTMDDQGVGPAERNVWGVDGFIGGFGLGLERIGARVNGSGGRGR